MMRDLEESDKMMIKVNRIDEAAGTFSAAGQSRYRLGMAVDPGARRGCERIKFILRCSPSIPSAANARE